MHRNLLILFCALLLEGGGVARGEVKARSTSASRQFIVYGAEVRVRGAVCDLAERTKANLLRVLGLRDNWKTPLVINLDYPQANLPELQASRFEVSQIGSGLKLQLNLLISNDLNGRAVARDLLRAILIEQIYRERTNVAAGSRYAAPPDWLLDGLLQLAPGHDSAAAAQLLETMIASNRIAPVDEIVRQKRELLEPSSRKIHDAYSFALIQLLLDSPNGPKKLLKFLQDLPDAPNDSVADLRAHFPNVLGGSARKWWTLSVARLSATDRYAILSAPETAQRLDQLLHLRMNGPDGKAHDYALSDYAAFRKLPGSRTVLRQTSEEFLLLSAHAHPSYRAIVQECSRITALLARGKTRNIGPRVKRVMSYRALVESQGRDMDDYLNWFEATQLRTMSGAFSEILQAAGEDEVAPPRRRDPISVYLDSIEASL
ncbi:MAG: hypothetical protein ACR2MW_10455 [Chthoniobacterales bacterium]